MFFFFFNNGSHTPFYVDSSSDEANGPIVRVYQQIKR